MKFIAEIKRQDHFSFKVVLPWCTFKQITTYMRWALRKRWHKMLAT